MNKCHKADRHFKSGGVHNACKHRVYATTSPLTKEKKKFLLPVLSKNPTMWNGNLTGLREDRPFFVSALDHTCGYDTPVNVSAYCG